MRVYSDRPTCDVLLDGFFWIDKDSNDLFLLAKDSSDEPDEGGETTGIASIFNLKQLDISIESCTEYLREYIRQILPSLDSSEADHINSKIEPLQAC